MKNLSVQSRFAETRFAETPTLTLTLNPNFGESGFGESGRHQRIWLEPGVSWRQPHRRSGLATLPSVGAVPIVTP